MDRSSKQLQELDSFPELQSLRRSFTSCQSKCACRVVGYMRNKNGEKRIQAERPRVQGNPPKTSQIPPRGRVAARCYQREAPHARGVLKFSTYCYTNSIASNGTDEHVTRFVERRRDATRQYSTIGSGGIDTPQHSPHTASRPQPQRRSARGTRKRGT